MMQKLQKWMSFLFWGSIWFTVVILADAAFLRVFFPDRVQVFVWLNMLTLYVYLPAYLFLLLAWQKKNKPLGVVSGVLILCHIIWSVPYLTPAEEVPTIVTDAPHLRLFSANIFMQDDITSFLGEVEKSQPDVIFIQELEGTFWTALQETDAFQRQYPYQFGDPRDIPFGSAIVSKYPLTDMKVWWQAGFPSTNAIVHVHNMAIRLYNVHPPTPVAALGEWRQQMGYLTDIAQTEEAPLIMIGDFNMTRDNEWYQHLEEAGLKNAHQVVGRSWAGTWPNSDRIAPFIRLDHAFLSSEFVALSATEGIVDGSDHKPIIVDMAIISQGAMVQK